MTPSEPIDSTGALLELVSNCLAVSAAPDLSCPRRTILIVDDERSVRISLEYVLASAGYHTVMAESGVAAITAFDEGAVDGALIDVHMPVMNGFDTCVRLKAKVAQRGQNVSVWLMTGACSAQVKSRSGEIGALGVLAKPFDYSTFFSTIEAGFSTPPPSAKLDDNAVNPAA